MPFWLNFRKFVCAYDMVLKRIQISSETFKVNLIFICICICIDIYSWFLGYSARIADRTTSYEERKGFVGVNH